MSAHNPCLYLSLLVTCTAYPALSAAQDSEVDPTESRPDRHHDIEEIVVEATALPRTVEQLSQPTAVLHSEELARKMAPSIGETLSSELGLSSTYFGPVASRPVIRGQFGERVRVLSNGLDALDASALSEDHQTAVEGILAERVEIVRGPATLLYGSGAAGGLVNVVDNRIAERPYGQSVTGKLALNGDTATGERAAAGWLAAEIDSLNVHFDYFTRSTDDVDIPGFVESRRLRAQEEAEGSVEEGDEARGRIDNTASRTDGGAVAMTWLGDDAFVGVSVSTYDSRYGVPGGHAHEEDEAVSDEDDVRIGLEQVRVDLQGHVGFDGVFDSLRFRVADNDYEHTEFEGGEVGTMFETDGFDGRIELRHRPLGKFEGALGVQHKRIDFSAIGAEAYVPGSNTTQTSLFLFEELPVTGRLVLQGSLRTENQRIEGSTLMVPYDGDSLSAAVGGIWAFSEDVSLAVHYSRSERHPTSTELYADGAHVAVRRYERGSVVLGDGVLSKERSDNLDVTLRGNTERLDWTITLFSNNADEYVVLSPTSEELDGFQVYEYGQVDAELYGYEAEARIELLDLPDGHLHSRVFSDYVFGEQTRSGEYLPRLPPLRYGLGLHYTFGDAEVSIEGTWYEKQSRTAVNELPTDSYVMFGAEFSYAMAQRGTFLFLKGSNLADEDARQHASPLKELAPLPGRSVHAGLRFEF